jgi:hypothetical protein
MFKERWHTSTFGFRKLGSLALVHQTITCIQPKFFVQIFIGVYPSKGLHHPINGCFPELIERRTPIETKLTTYQAIRCHMDLLITTDIGAYCSETSVTIKAEEWE